jgi:hypothetical protein
VLYLMGVMGHYVGDCSQPLHTTKHFNGWVGPNPKGYTTWRGFHSWIDGGLIAKAGIRLENLLPRVRSAQPISLAPREDGRDPMFVAVIHYLLEQHKAVEPLYQLEKDGKVGRGDQPVAPEAQALIERQLLAGGQMLGALWLTAWRHVGPDTFLRAALIKRQAAAAVPAGTR